MGDIVWYIAYSEQAGTHVILPAIPDGIPVLVKEEVFPVGWPASDAIIGMVTVAERLRNAGSSAQGLAFKIVMKSV